MSEGAAGRTSIKTSGFRFKPVRSWGRVQCWQADPPAGGLAAASRGLVAMPKSSRGRVRGAAAEARTGAKGRGDGCCQSGV